MLKIVRTGGEPKPATSARPRTRKQKETRDDLMVTWLTMALCALVSILFNVRGTAMHTHEALALGSAMIWPAVSVLGVHVAARGSSWGSGFWWGLARYGVMAGGAVASMVLSMTHTRAVLLMYGADSAAAVAGPLVLDAVMVVCGLKLINARTSNTRTSTSTAGKGRGTSRKSSGKPTTTRKRPAPAPQLATAA